MNDACYNVTRARAGVCGQIQMLAAEVDFRMWYSSSLKGGLAFRWCFSCMLLLNGTHILYE